MIKDVRRYKKTLIVVSPVLYIILALGFLTGHAKTEKPKAKRKILNTWPRPYCQQKGRKNTADRIGLF